MTIPAVILAAGLGTRLRPYTEERPKCMLELEPGKTVLDLILSQLEGEGVKEVYIVTNPRYKEVLERRYGEKVKVLVVEGEGFGNLFSLATALKKVGDKPFLLLMSDHIFERELLRRLLRCKAGENVIFTLCLDRFPSWEKAREGLKVVLGEKGVELVGKALPPYHGIDTGLFICYPGVKEVVEKVIREKGPKAVIADAVNEAVKTGRVDYVDVTGLLWMDIDTPEDLEEARKMYWRILRRDLIKPTDGPVSRYLNRPISTRISVFLYKKRLFIPPNVITLLNFLLCMLSAVLLYIGLWIPGGILTQVSSVIDGVDGELARLYKAESKLGALLDSVVDRYADLAIIAGLGLSMGSLNALTMALILVASANIVMVSYASHLAEKMGVKVGHLRSSFPWATRDVRLFVVALSAIFAVPLICFIYLAVFPTIYVARVLRYMVKTAGPQPPPKVKRLLTPKPLPVLQRPKERLGSRVKRELSSILSNALKLLIGLTTLSLLRPVVHGVALLDLGFTTLTSDLLLDGVATILVIYLGYKLVSSVKFFLERASDRLVRALNITGFALKRLGMDIGYLVLLVALWFLLNPYVRLLTGVLSVLLRIVLLVLFVLTLLIIYDIVRIFYQNLKGAWEEFIERVTEKQAVHRKEENQP